MQKSIIISLLSVSVFLSIKPCIAQNIPMTFHNGSICSIYLSIPGVMNPNLFPKSNSGVSLDAGQVVYFYPNGKRGKKEVLFTVNATWKKDTILQIDEIIKVRKKTLSAK